MLSGFPTAAAAADVIKGKVTEVFTPEKERAPLPAAIKANLKKAKAAKDAADNAEKAPAGAYTGKAVGRGRGRAGEADIQG